MTTFTSSADIEADAWDSFVGSNVLLHRNFLRSGEASGLGFAPRYFVGYEGRRPLGIAAATLRELDLAEQAPHILRMPMQGIRRLAPRFLRMSMLDLGAFASDGLTIAADPRDRELWATMVLDEAETSADLVVMRDFVGPEHPLESQLVQRGYAQVIEPPTVAMTFRWNSYNDFTASLRSKYRCALRQVERRALAAGVRFELSNEPLAPLDQYVQLFENVHQKQAPGTPPPGGPRYFEAMVEHCRDQSLWFQYFRGNELVAFVHCLRQRDELWSMFIGMNYDVCLPIRLYFETYHQQIRYAFESGIRYVHFGSGAYTAKTEVGCSVLPQRTYMRHRSATMTRVLSGLRRLTYRPELPHLHRSFHDKAHQYLWRGDDPLMRDGEQFLDTPLLRRAA